MKGRFLQILATVVAFSSTPLVNFAQAPNLGTAANFVLFTTTGAVGNTGISQLTGNVGTNSGSSTGFGNVNGVMHNNDGATAQAASDLLTAYNTLNSTVANFSHAPLLGNGDTLIAGVYAISGQTTLSGNLTLDGKGNPNAVFIFQVSAAFSTAAEAKIKLINGTQACNVFWKIEGMVNMAAGTSFKGNLIVNNAAISMSTRDTLEGRALSTTGAVNITGTMAYTPTGCGSAVLTGPAAPDLKTTGCYAIFSGNGSVANADVSHATGDIGTNVGLTTGYDPLMVQGTIHANPDGSTSACAADLLTVYNYLNTLTEDIELLYPAQFGQNLVLTPHTYVMKSATALTDTLYLNAQGNPNAVFVIKITGALGTSTNARVVLVNGAQAKNVYWKVDGAISISDNSVMKGTFIANNAAIDLKTGVVIDGRALTTNGALSTAAVTVTIPAGTCGQTLATSNWLYFRAKPTAENVLLEWGTTNQMKDGFFTIERSLDGKIFETVTTVNANREGAKPNFTYSFTDNQSSNTSYYRISHTGINGERTYYNTLYVKMNAGQSFKASVYVQESYIYVQASGATPGNGSLELYSIEGKKISSQKIVLTQQLSAFKIEKPKQTGTYLVQLIGNGEKLYAGKVMVF